MKRGAQADSNASGSGKGRGDRCSVSAAADMTTPSSSALIFIPSLGTIGTPYFEPADGSTNTSILTTEVFTFTYVDPVNDPFDYRPENIETDDRG